ncbi:MAG: hypothetical protein ACREFW_09260 [Rhizomicrobium sp.]
MSMDFDIGPLVLTVIRTGTKQKAETYEVETLGLGLNGALQFVARGEAHSISAGGWKSFEVTRPGFRLQQLPDDVARQKSGRRPRPL